MIPCHLCRARVVRAARNAASQAVGCTFALLSLHNPVARAARATGLCRLNNPAHCWLDNSLKRLSCSNQSPSRARPGHQRYVAGCQASKTAFRSHCARPTGRYMCERGVLSEFRAARTCASYWFDNVAGGCFAAARAARACRRA